MPCDVPLYRSVFHLLPLRATEFHGKQTSIIVPQPYNKCTLPSTENYLASTQALHFLLHPIAFHKGLPAGTQMICSSFAYYREKM